MFIYVTTSLAVLVYCGLVIMMLVVVMLGFTAAFVVAVVAVDVVVTPEACLVVD
jgi:hypothetical protein